MKCEQKVGDSLIKDSSSFQLELIVPESQINSQPLAMAQANVQEWALSSHKAH